MLSELINNSPKTLRNELYRKSIHLSSVWMPLLIYFAPQKLSLLIFAVLFTADLFIEYGCYKKNLLDTQIIRRAVHQNSARPGDPQKSFPAERIGISAGFRIFVCLALSCRNSRHRHVNCVNLRYLCRNLRQNIRHAPNLRNQIP